MRRARICAASSVMDEKRTSSGSIKKLSRKRVAKTALSFPFQAGFYFLRILNWQPVLLGAEDEVRLVTVLQFNRTQAVGRADVALHVLVELLHLLWLEVLAKA